MNDIIKSIAFKNGLITGVSITFLYVIFYVVDVELLANFWVGLFVIIVLIIVGFITAAKIKASQEGFLSFKEGFTSFIVPIIIGLIIPLLFVYLLFNFIDTDAANMLKEIGLEKAEEMMKRFGAPESEIEKALVKAEADNPYSISNILLQYGSSIIFTAVIGLIGALTMKKNREHIG